MVRGLLSGAWIVPVPKSRNPPNLLHATSTGEKFFSRATSLCDTDYRFRDVFVGFPGSAHDARVLKESSFFENIARKCSDDCILKNAVHPLLPELMPPYKENQATFQNYKDYLNKYPCTATENAFGIPKQRFRRLYFVDAETTNLEACVRHPLYCKGRDGMDALSRLERQGM